jgi:O-methyltransferase
MMSKEKVFRARDKSWTSCHCHSLVRAVAATLAVLLAFLSIRDLTSVIRSFERGSALTLLSSKVSSNDGDPYHQQCLDIRDPSITVAMSNPPRYTPAFGIENTSCLVYTPPSPYISLLRQTLMGDPRGGRCIDGFVGCDPPHALYNKALRYGGDDWPPYGYTMVGFYRLEQMRAAVQEVEREKTPGAIMELGVWRGGLMLYAAAVIRERRDEMVRNKHKLPPPRDLFLLDAFERIDTYGLAANYLHTLQQDVEDAFDLFGLRNNPQQNVTSEANSNIHIVKGYFNETVPKWAATYANQSIAILRLDGNFYDSYQIPFYYLYEKIPIGGIVIFDDIGSHPEVQQAWSDFQVDQKFNETLTYIDMHGAWFRKSKLVHVDQSKYHKNH